eukprot:11937999-Alexandrium_andersonii.AAC.1
MSTLERALRTTQQARSQLEQLEVCQSARSHSPDEAALMATCAALAESPSYTGPGRGMAWKHAERT